MSNWVYKGPIYDNFYRYMGDLEIWTSASSFGRAKSNILYNAKEQLGLPPSSKLYIDEELIGEVSQDVPEQPKPEGYEESKALMDDSDRHYDKDDVEGVKDILNIFDYYIRSTDPITDDEIEICSDYGLTPVSWYKCKDEFYEILSDSALDFLLGAKESDSDEVRLYQWVGDRLYEPEDEVMNLISKVVSSVSVIASTKRWNWKTAYRDVDKALESIGGEPFEEIDNDTTCWEFKDNTSKSKIKNAVSKYLKSLSYDVERDDGNIYMTGSNPNRGLEIHIYEDTDNENDGYVYFDVEVYSFE